MGLLQLLCLAVGLSMDACAAAICKGLSLGTARVGDALTVGLYFGTFQAVMPLIGWLLGVQFQGPAIAWGMPLPGPFPALTTGWSFSC